MIRLKFCYPVLLRSFSSNSILYRYSNRFSVKLEGVDLKKIIHALENGVFSLANLENQNRTEIMSCIAKRQEVLQNLEVLKDLEVTESKQDMKKWISDESQIFLNSLEKLDAMLTEAIFSICEPDNVSTVFLEVSGKVGGLEAMLFAHELFQMYCNFIDHMGWDKEIVHYDPSSLGGMRHATLIVSGENVYRMLRYEAGVHRVQRVPTTEKHGRMHTSTVSVSLIPRPNDIETIINEKDIRIETKRASGAGGQHVNTTDSAVRITHIPTGISTECQSERSQIKNKELAMKKLQYILYQQQREIQETERQATKKFQVGTSNRNEKIRTYNFTQDRVTDHRIKNGTIHNIKAFLEGGYQLENFIISIMLDKLKEQIMSQISDPSKGSDQPLV